MHSLSRLFAAATAVALLASPAVAQEEDLIVAIYKSGTQQYFIDQAEGFISTAEELGYEAQTINVELDANRAITAISDAIAAGADGIAITAPDQALGPAIAKAAADAGIPVVATDDRLENAEGEQIPFVGFDGVDMGTRVGETAADLLQESGWMENANYGVISTEVQTLSVCNDRTGAARQQLLDAGVPEENFVTVPYDGTTNSALQAAGPVITANPQFEKWVVYACNDEGALGVVNALQNAGFGPDDAIAVGLGAYEACRPWEAGVPTMFKAGLYLSGADVGAAAARALINTIENGEPLPQNTVADTTIVTPENYAEVMPCD